MNPPLITEDGQKDKEKLSSRFDTNKSICGL